MRIVSLLRTATLALALTAALGATTGAFAAPIHKAFPQRGVNDNPYDSPNFTVPSNDIFS